MGVAVFAEGTAEDLTAKISVTDAAKFQKALDSAGGSTGVAGLTYASGVFTWDGGTEFSELTKSDQKKGIKKLMTIIEDSDVSIEGTNAINDLLSETTTDDLDMSILLLPYIYDQTKGDVLGGAKVLSGFFPIIKIILGVAAILLIAVTGVSSALDMAYIGVPQVREMMDEKGSNGNGGGGGSSKPRGVTHAAYQAISEVEGNGGGGAGDKGSNKNIYWSYFKRRIFDYIFLGIAVVFLIVGGFGNLVTSVLEIGKGLVGG